MRGFGTQFNELLSNGRPIASGNGQNFDFSALGAEYVGEVDVHKTPDFSPIHGRDRRDHRHQVPESLR